MARKNTVRRYPPVDYYDVTAVERWLERMALNGCKLFAHFTGRPPAPPATGRSP